MYKIIYRLLAISWYLHLFFFVITGVGDFVRKKRYDYYLITKCTITNNPLFLV